MEQKNRFLSVVVFCIVFSTVFFLPLQVWAEWKQEVQEIAAQNRPNHATSIDEAQIRGEFTELLYHYESLDGQPIITPVAPEPSSPRVVISNQEAVEDVEYLFSVMKYGYVGYQYFGGDERFGTAKERILEQLQARTSHEMAVRTFYDLLCDHLGFINDGHFYLGNRSFRRAQVMMMDFDYGFLRDENGYYTKRGGTKAYLELVNGEPPDPYLWPALNGDGEIVYRIGRLRSTDEGDDAFELIELLLRAGESTRQDYAVIEPSTGSALDGDGYEQYSLDGVPVVSLRSFPYGSAMKDFVQDAYDLKLQDAFVIDLRSNRGGDTGALLEWMEILADGPIGFPHASVGLKTETVDTLARMSWPLIQPELYRPEKGWTEIMLHLENIRIDNQAKIVVLTDSHTVSAGELFVELLRRVENVVFIGVNTAGAYLTGNPVWSSLPNSGLELHFGTALFLAVDAGALVDREGKGFLPDFWVRPEDALDLAIRFIRNYGLK